MGVERLREIAGELREFARWAQNNYVQKSVRIEQDDYYFDLGQFGEGSTTVLLEDDYYEFDADSLLEDFPLQSSDFDSFADELDTIELPDDELDAVLVRMESNGEGSLARAIRNIVEIIGRAKTELSTGVINLAGLSVGPLPSSPLPWPGALRPEIDYTADDFVFRYQPPPGFAWAQPGKPYDVATPDQAEGFDTSYLRESPEIGYMILDDKGRISWVNRDGDQLASGKRWALWFNDRDGIPAAGGDFNQPTLPLAIDADGNVIGTWRSSSGNTDVWRTSGDGERGRQRVRELREQYERSLLSVNEYGVTYDPLTVELGEETRTQTTELRIGDWVNSYGRVLSVERLDGGTYKLLFAEGDSATRIGDPERRQTDTRGDYNWYMYPIKDRDNQPTALSLSVTPRPRVDYDPLTVEVDSASESIRADQLRVGDDVTGSGFGRVLAVTPLANGNVSIKMNRDGRINVQNGYSASQTWNVLPITGVDRKALPTALSLSTESSAYDPLTVSLSDSEIDCPTSELRLGDDILGESYGRVTNVSRNDDGVYTIEMNRDGEVNTSESSIDETWFIFPIDGVDRDAQPTALSAEPVPAPF